MKKQAKQKEVRRVKNIKYPQEELYEEEEIPEKDKDGIEMVPSQKRSEKTLIVKRDAFS